MQNQILPFDWETMPERLEVFLNARIPDKVPDDADLGIFSLYQLEGLFAALHTMPELVPPSQWLELVWGDFPPSDDTMMQGMSLILALYNEIGDLLRKDLYVPLWADLEEGEWQKLVDAAATGGASLPEALFPATVWLQSYMSAFMRFSPKTLAVLDGLEELMKREDAGETLDEGDAILVNTIIYPLTYVSALLAQLSEYHEKPLPGLEEKEVADKVLEMVAMLPIALYEALTPEREKTAAQAVEIVRRDHPKVGRNDPCPCGSGKKYKKCCLQ